MHVVHSRVAALRALSAFPGGLQTGGGITSENAAEFISAGVFCVCVCSFRSLTLVSAGASHVIVTSFIFRDGALDPERLKALVTAVGKEKLVLDLSCRKRKPTTTEVARESTTTQTQAAEYFVVVDKWQTFTSLKIEKATLQSLADFCSECAVSHSVVLTVRLDRRFLVHGVDVEGKRQGVDLELVSLLSALSPIPVTYAGGVRDLTDCENVLKEGKGRVHLSIGSALDVFGGTLAFATVVDWFQARTPSASTTESKTAAASTTPATSALPAHADQPFCPAVYLFEGRAVLPKSGVTQLAAVSASDVQV